MLCEMKGFDSFSEELNLCKLTEVQIKLYTLDYIHFLSHSRMFVCNILSEIYFLACRYKIK